MMEDLFLHLRRPMARATRKREPNNTPVTISTALTQEGFESSCLLDVSSRGRCLLETPGWLLGGGGGGAVLPVRIYVTINQNTKSSV